MSNGSMFRYLAIFSFYLIDNRMKKPDLLQHCNATRIYAIIDMVLYFLNLVLNILTDIITTYNSIPYSSSTLPTDLECLCD